MVKEKPETVRIQLLGDFRVSVGSRTVGEDGWRLKKARSLVKLLALSPNHRLHREQVMEQLWLDSHPKAAANNLRQALHVARRVLKSDPDAASEYLRLRDDWLELCSDRPLWVDVEAFQEAASRARRAREPAGYRVAIDLYTGNLLPHDRYEAWVEDRREGLRRTYLELLSELGGLYEERGELDAAIKVLGKTVTAEPTHEEAHLKLMRLYVTSGRRHEAVLQYERLRKVLSEGLGVQLAEVTQRLYEQIQVGNSNARSRTEGRTVLVATPEQPQRHNLPAERASFVGREKEMVEVERLLSMTRLLTLTGAGGSGKTRFALAVARNFVGTYPDGVWWAELAPLSEGELMPQAVAAAINVREQPDRPISSTLKDFLYPKKLLLVLDNCEHVIETAARMVETLLDSCPGLRVLVTSREALNVAGELVWSVSPLSVPDPGHTSSVEDLAKYESVQLFAERARYRDPAFDLTSENVRVVTEICRRLGGIPLAIELAAAKVGALSVEQISGRLEGSLKMLAGGRRTAPPRQQTLTGALDWSHELLTVPERSLFGRLSVFAGGWTLEAAEAVGAGDGIEESEVLDLLLRLVDKSLVVAEANEEGELRYGMLEPVRQYGLERLEESGEAERIREQHAGYYLALAERAEPGLRGRRQEAWLERLEIEHDNLRAALSWALEGEEAESGLRLGKALGAFWHMHGHLSEGRRWLERGLAKTDASSASERAKALNEAGWIAMLQGDYERSATLIEEGLMLFRRMGDKAGTANALCTLGWTAFSQNELEQASALVEEAMTLDPSSEDGPVTIRSFQVLGLVAMARRDLERAAELHEQALALARKSGDGYAVALSLMTSASSYLGLGDHRRVIGLCEESLRLSWRSRMTRMVVANLHLLAAVAGTRGQPEHSARLWGAAESLRETIGAIFSPAERSSFDSYIAYARAKLSEAAWEAAWAEGRAMTPEQTIQYALSEEKTPILAPGQAPADKKPAETLTPREQEIAALVAWELTNRQISQELLISERTVTTHVYRILKKLGLRSRTQISAWVLEQRLLP